MIFFSSKKYLKYGLILCKIYLLGRQILVTIMVKAGSYERKPFHIESEIQKVKGEKQNETIIQTADVFVV